MSACTHWWRCDSVPAVCKHCGETRVFKAYVSQWNGQLTDREAEYERRHARRSSKQYAMGE